ncbi:MAG: tyrosine--tRNA ligase [Brevinema sp.]
MTAEEQLNIIKQGVVDLLPEEMMLEKLKKGKPLKIKLGADPSAPDLHLGHAVILRKLRQLQELGHQIIFLIGDFTAMIGDPSGKNEMRKPLTKEEVLKNAETYKQQIFKILDAKKTIISFNSEWLASLTFTDLLCLTSHVTVAQLLERDDFSKRFNDQRPISLVEFMYPLAQAYDSVALEADVETGGTDQKFNLLFGRALQHALGQEAQCILTMPIIEGTDGVQKMSKSLNNYIGITETPENMFGKIMSIPDSLIEKYFELLTDTEITIVKKRLSDGENPRNLKVELGKDIVTQYHSHVDADKALEHFENLFKKGGIPEEMPELLITKDKSIVDCLVESGLADSKGAVRRLIAQNAISIDGEKIKEECRINTSCIIRMGKLKFLRIKKNNI